MSEKPATDVVGAADVVGSAVVGGIVGIGRSSLFDLLFAEQPVIAKTTTTRNLL